MSEKSSLISNTASSGPVSIREDILEVLPVERAEQAFALRSRNNFKCTAIEGAVNGKVLAV